MRIAQSCRGHDWCDRAAGGGDPHELGGHGTEERCPRLLQLARSRANGDDAIAGRRPCEIVVQPARRERLRAPCPSIGVGANDVAALRITPCSEGERLAIRAPRRPEFADVALAYPLWPPLGKLDHVHAVERREGQSSPVGRWRDVANLMRAEVDCGVNAI